MDPDKAAEKAVARRGWFVVVVIVVVATMAYMVNQRQRAKVCASDAAKACASHGDCFSARVSICGMDAFNHEVGAQCKESFRRDCDERHWNQGKAYCIKGRCQLSTVHPDITF